MEKKDSVSTRKANIETAERRIEQIEELYMSDGEDGRPTIKWRRKQTINHAGEGEKQRKPGRWQKQKEMREQKQKAL